jgi:general secretion pathway protein G
MVGIMMPDITGTGMKMPQVDVPSKSNLNIAGKIADGKVVVDIAVPKQHLAELVSAVMIMQQQMQKQESVIRTKATMAMLESAVKRFRLDTGRYPTDEEGLTALIEPPANAEKEKWNGPYIDGSFMPKDAWNNYFVYKLDPAGDKFTIISYGADGEEGGDDLNKDLLSTD